MLVHTFNDNGLASTEHKVFPTAASSNQLAPIIFKDQCSNLKGGKRRVSPVQLIPNGWVVTAWLCFCNRPRFGAAALLEASPPASKSRPRGLPLSLTDLWHGDFLRSLNGSELPECALRRRASPGNCVFVHQNTNSELQPAGNIVGFEGL